MVSLYDKEKNSRREWSPDPDFGGSRKETCSLQGLKGSIIWDAGIFSVIIWVSTRIYCCQFPF
jgi:hypothetical protein